MHGIGTLINVIFIIIGTFIGLLLKNGVKERFQTTVISAIGFSTCFIGISGVLTKMLTVQSENGHYSLSSQSTMLLVISLVVGAFFGEWIDIEKRLETFGTFLKSKIKIKGENETFVQGFVAASLLYCIGAMAIVGSIEDGLTGNFSTLFAKAVMDGTISIFYAATFGVGVAFSVIPVGIYQGLITLFAGLIAPYLTPLLIDQVSMIGSVLIFGIGINMLCKTKIRIGNLLPAILVPPIYMLLQKLWMLIF